MEDGTGAQKEAGLKEGMAHQMKYPRGKSPYQEYRGQPGRPQTQGLSKPGSWTQV